MTSIRFGIVLASLKLFTIETRAMKRSKFTTLEGLVMLFGMTIAFMEMMWLVLSGVLQIKD